MKNKIEILINSDFALNQYVNNLNKDLQNKLDFKLKPNNQENLNICLFKNENYNNKIIIFLSQIEKTFLNFKKFEDEGKINLRKFEKEISLFAKKIESLSKLSRHIIFFLWPMDIKDSYYGNYNFKKEGKNWLINFTNVFLTSKISHINNLIVNDPNYNLLT